MGISEMNVLKLKLDKIITYIVDKDDVIFVDYPVYHNVGDLLIFRGTLELLSEHNVKIKAFRSVIDYNYDDIKNYVTPSTTILCQGGGNFGDIYPAHQQLRESVVEHFPKNRIIVLPQTAYFSSEQNFQKSLLKLNKHQDLILFARDQNTLNIFDKLTTKALLSPDMAHALYGKLKKSEHKNHGVLYFLRADCEINEFQKRITFPAGTQSKDWSDFITIKDRLYRRFISYMFFISNKLNSAKFKDLTAYLWRNHCNKLVSRSFVYFSQFNEIVTSRMHGHILACLVDVPNKVIDNSYGKNSGYFNEWTRTVPTSSLFDAEKEK
ncbi:polysaccharide pyruvyl transferase family protein [Pluralibacter gergoviae]